MQSLVRVAGGLGLSALVAPVLAAVSLSSYNVDINQSSVSGISSGAYMAVQLGVAHSSIFKGVGVLAGGPYYCSQGSMITALGTCMEGSPDAAGLANTTRNLANSGAIDAVSNIGKQKILLFSGYNDGLVKQSVMNSLYSYYRNFTDAANIFYKNNLNAAHAQVTDNFGPACNYTGGKFINNCGWDGAGQILQHIYGTLNPRNTGALSGSIIEFNQNEFAAGPDAWLIGMSHYGFAYVPASCAAGQPCKVHVALHGCKQYATILGDAFYRNAGYNQWADTNQMIILYPQTVATTVTPLNPNGCWDWWGYVNSDFATKRGRQIASIRGMLDRLAGRFTGPAAVSGSFGTPTGVVAKDSTASMVDVAWKEVAGATGYHVYRAGSASGSFSKLTAAPVTGLSYSDSGRLPSTTYYYKVTAVNASGESAPSAVVSKATAANPAACDPYFADNVTHSTKGRAYVLFGLTYARGSSQYMGLWNMLYETPLRKVGSSYYIGPCA